MDTLTAFVPSCYIPLSSIYNVAPILYAILLPTRLMHLSFRVSTMLMLFIRWLTTTPKGRQVAGPYFFIGVIFLIPFIAQAVGVLPRSTDAGLMIAIIALASLVAGIVELLPR